MASALSHDIERALGDAARARPELEVLVLFGSAAKGRLNAASDIDLYARVARGHSFDRAAQAGFAAKASQLCKREIDLVVEDPSTSVILRRQVAAEGKVLFERAPGAARALKVEAVRAYVELEPQLREIGAAIRARAIRAGTMRAGESERGPEMVDEHLVEQRLAAIRDRLDRIARVLPAERAQFVADRTAQEVVAFNLFLAFQEALDLAGHVIADRGLELPTTAREHFEILARANVLTSEVAAATAGCAGLRNLITHAYGTLDLARLYDELPAGRDALTAFCAEIAAAR